MPKSKKSSRTKRRCKFGICPSRPASSSSSPSSTMTSKKTRKTLKKKTTKTTTTTTPRKAVAVSYQKKSRTPRKAITVSHQTKPRTPREQVKTPLREPPCPPFQFTPHKLTPRQGGEILPSKHIQKKLDQFIKDLFIDDKKERIKNTLEYIIKRPELDKKYLSELIKFINGFNDKYLVLEDGELHPHFKKCLYRNLNN